MKIIIIIIIMYMYNDYLKTVVSHRRQQGTLIYNFPATDANAAVVEINALVP